MFTVKCKHFSDANFNKFLNIRKFFAIFFKKKFTISPSFVNFCYQGKGANKSTSQQANKSTSQQVEVRQVRQVRQEMGLMGPRTKHPFNPLIPIYT